jgi:hypothetical protein
LTRVRAELALRQGDAAGALRAVQAQLAEMAASPSSARNLTLTLPLAVDAALAAGRHGEARAHADALMQAALRVARVPEHSAHVGRAFSALGGVHQAEGQPSEAAASWRRALTILTHALGAEHPEVLSVRTRLSLLR